MGVASKRSETTRAAIIDSALRLFAEQGYETVRVEDIARAAGVSRATVYNHFAERDEILAALFERLLGGDGSEPTPDGGDPLAQIRAVAADAAKRMLTDEPLARLVYTLPVRHESLLKPDQPTTPAAFRTIHRLLEQAAARGQIRDDVPVDLLCVHVHSALETGMRAWAEGRTDDPVGRVNTLVDLALTGITR